MNRLDVLSTREREVLSLAVSGLSNQQIAQELVISVHTVKAHLNHIIEKLDARSSRQAIAIGARCEVTPPAIIKTELLPNGYRSTYGGE